MLLESKASLSNKFFIQIFLFFKNSDCHKISFLNDGGLKLGHFDIFDMLFPFVKCAKLWPGHSFMKSRSRDGLAAKGLLQRTTTNFTHFAYFLNT